MINRYICCPTRHRRVQENKFSIGGASGKKAGSCSARIVRFDTGKSTPTN